MLCTDDDPTLVSVAIVKVMFVGKFVVDLTRDVSLSVALRGDGLHCQSASCCWSSSRH